MKEALFIWAAIQSLLFGILFLTLKKKKSNHILGLFFVLISLDLFSQYLLRFKDYVHLHPQIIFISDTLGFASGPLLFLYVRQLWYQSFQKYYYLHFLPAIVVCVFLYTNYFFTQPSFQPSDYINTWTHTIVLFGITASQLIYFTFYLSVIRSHQLLKSVKAPLAGWLSVIFLLFIINTIRGAMFFVPNLYRNIAGIAQSPSQVNIAEYIFIALNAIIILMTTLWLIYNSNMFKAKTLAEDESSELSNDEDSEENKETSGKQKFQIPKKEAEVLLQKLHDLIESNKIYLQQNINEKKLAEILGVPSYYVSNLLNDHLNKSFTVYINTLRIEHAKQLISEDKDSKMTNFAIALDCGYSTESTFYVNFKRFTGLTPKQFKESISVKGIERS